MCRFSMPPSIGHLLLSPTPHSPSKTVGYWKFESNPVFSKDNLATEGGHRFKMIDPASRSLVRAAFADFASL